MYKLKLLFVVLCFSFIFQSCHSQQFDLEKLLLPVQQTELKQLDLSPSGAGIGSETVQYSSYFSDAVDDKKMSISFGGIKIESAPASDSFTQSMLRLYGKNKGSIEGFTLNIGNSESFGKVLKYLLNNKNKFKLVFDNGKDNEERARVFINEANKTTYLVLSRSNNGQKIGYVEGINSQEKPLLTSRLGGAFGYYKDYLEYRTHKSAGFSYLDFLKETDNAIYKENNNLH